MYIHTHIYNRITLLYTSNIINLLLRPKKEKEDFTSKDSIQRTRPKQGKKSVMHMPKSMYQWLKNS